MATNYPSHPVFAWRPTITGTVDYDDGTDSGTIDLATDIASSYWGWSSNASNVAQSDSVQARFAALLVAALSSSTVSFVITYTWPDGTAAPPVASYAMTHSGNVNVDLTFSSADVAAQFGFDGASVTLTYLTDKAADFTDAGHWQPSCRGGYDERWDSNPNIGVTESNDGSTRKIRVWGDDLTDRPFMFPTVMVANVRADAAADASMAAAAQRDVSDPNSLLANMVSAARTPENTDDARAFRVYTAAGTYRTCYWLRKDEIQAVQSICSNKSARRIWEVSFTMRDDG